jgi:hypothetical protein
MGFISVAEGFKKSGKAEYCISGTLQVWIDSLLVERQIAVAVWGDSKGEAASEITAAQGQALPTGYHVTNRLQ